jgi:FkbM family methyltransferase
MIDSDPPISFSQYGEDLLVWKHFGEKKTGFFVEVGANDPEENSQTLLLERNGWTGILVEPQSACCERLHRNRRKAQLFQVACGSPEQRGMACLQLKGPSSKLISSPSVDLSVIRHEAVRVITLDDVLEQAGNPQIDYLSIDVEGNDWEVLRGFDIKRHRPRLILIEDDYHSRLKIYWYLKRQGYRLVKRTGSNNWYIPEGQRFTLTTGWEKAKLFRKIFLSTPIRRLKGFVAGDKKEVSNRLLHCVDSDRINLAPSTSFSQYGEDLLVWKYFGEKKSGVFVEVGANDPEESSQTFLLERNGWSGILVEPQTSCCERIRQVRPRAQLFQVACGSPEQRGKAFLQLDGQTSKLIPDATRVSTIRHEEVQVITLNEVLEQARSPQIDFLSIDVEGNDLQVLRGFDVQRYHPRLIVIEDDHQSCLEIYWYMKRQGYRLVKRTGRNSWYIPKNQSFKVTSRWEKIMLFRKMFLSTPIRLLKSVLTGKKRENARLDL